jgi:hypothetical protein
MAIALVQSRTGTSTTAITTASFSVAPTSGNLVVLGFASDDYNGTPDAGWTQSTGLEQQTFHGGYLWWRISNGSNSLQYTIGSATRSSWLLMEFSGVHATPYDISNGTILGSSGNTLATPSIIPTTGNRVLVAGWGASNSAGLSIAGFGATSDSFSTPVISSAGEITAYAMAYRLVTGNGSTGYSSTLTISGGGTPQRMTGLILSLKEAATLTAYSITAVASSYALNGNLPTFLKTWKPTAVASSYAITGTPVTTTFLSNKTIAASASTYALTGAPVTLSKLTYRVTTALAGSYTLTGTAVALGRFSGTPAFRSISSTGYGLKTETIVPTPAGTVAGDILIAGVFVVYGATFLDDVIIPPASWVRVGVPSEVNAGGVFGHFYVWWKRAGTEGPSQTFAHVGTTSYTTQGVIAAYSGGSASGSPVDVFSQNAASTGSTATYTSVTTTMGNTRLVLLGHNWDGTGALTPPTGTTERFDHLVYVADESRAATGVTGDRTQTLASSAPWHAFLLALKPGGAPSFVYAVTAMPGAYTLTGRDVTLRLSSARSIVATAGSYSLTGSPVSIGSGTATAPVFRAVSSTSYAARVDTIVTKPTGTVDGDVLVAGLFVGHGASFSDVVTPPAGWTQIGVTTSVTDNSFYGQFSAYWHRAAADGADYTFSHVDHNTQGVVAAYSGVVPFGLPIDAFSQNIANTGAIATASGVTTTNPNAKLVYVGHNWDGSAALTPPTGMTERFDGLAYLSDETKVSVGATGDRTQALVSSNPWAAFLVALKPSGTIAPPTTYSVIAVAGSYRLTGTTITTGRGLLSASGSYSFTGKPVLLRTTATYGLVGSGGSYALSGLPVTLTHVTVPVSTLSGMNVWTGSAWAAKPAKVWTGTAWVEKPVKVWNGSTWL